MVAYRDTRINRGFLYYQSFIIFKNMSLEGMNNPSAEGGPDMSWLTPDFMKQEAERARKEGGERVNLEISDDIGNNPASKRLDKRGF